MSCLFCFFCRIIGLPPEEEWDDDMSIPRSSLPLTFKQPLHEVLTEIDPNDVVLKLLDVSEVHNVIGHAEGFCVHTMSLLITSNIVSLAESHTHLSRLIT